MYFLKQNVIVNSQSGLSYPHETSRYKTYGFIVRRFKIMIIVVKYEGEGYNIVMSD